MATVYEVKRGDSPWKLAAARLGEGATNQQIAAEVKRLPSIYGCSSMEEFQRKYFSKPGNKIKIDFNGNNGNRSPQARAGSRRQIPSVITAHEQMRASIGEKFDSSQYLRCDAIKPDSNTLLMQQLHQADSAANRMQRTSRRNRQQQRTSGTPVQPVDTPPRYALPENLTSEQLRRLVYRGQEQNWADIQATQNRINGLATDKEKVIAYNREIGNLSNNYIIVDKKNYTATVYTPDGQVVKEYEIGVSDNVSDQLLEGNASGHGWNIRATSAGIYTANYRASGRDAYARTYGHRILTLSNDALKEKGVGNGSGETGVALHQIPNGRGGQVRAAKLRKPGVSSENNRFSAGCVNFLPEDFDDCMRQIQGVGTKVYILPEDDNNYMCVKNGQLHLAQKRYTGNVATTMPQRDPIKDIRITVSNEDLRDEASAMARTLSSYKTELTRTLGLDNDTYNILALRTLGIAGQETKYGSPTAGTGDGKPYWMKENMTGFVNFIKEDIMGNDSYNSRGITQLKISSYTDPDTKRLLQEYGITEDNLGKPENAAIATMIVLSCIYKNELPALKAKMEELGISKEDALLYCFNGRKSEIRNGTATPDQNIYIQKVRKYEQDFNLRQFERAAT